MTQELLGATLDLSFILWLWVPGVAVAIAWGMRHPLDVLPAGFLISTAAATSTYSVTYLLGQSTHTSIVVRVVVAVIGLTALFFIRGQLGLVIRSAGLALVVATVSVTLRNILRLDGWMLGNDHYLNGWIALLMQQGEEGEMYFSSEVQKKGLTLPILLSLGRQDLLLGAIPTLIFGLVILASYRLVAESLAKRERAAVVVGFVALLVVWSSTPMFVGLAFYQHAHGFVALCLAVMVRWIVSGEQESRGPRLSRRAHQAITPHGHALVLFVSAFVLGQSRVEGFLLAVLVLLPYLGNSATAQEWREGSRRVLAAAAGPLGFSVWFATTGDPPVGFVPDWVLYAIVIGAGCLVGGFLFAFPPATRWFLGAIPAVMVGALVVFLLPLASSRNNLSPLVSNTFLGGGLWGYVWWLVIVLLLVVAIDRSRTPRESLLLWFAVTILLFTVFIKATDGLPAGKWGRIREGWGDSVNRTLFHSFPLVMATSVLAFTQLAERFSGGAKRGRKRGNFELQESSSDQA